MKQADASEYLGWFDQAKCLHVDVGHLYLLIYSKKIFFPRAE